MPNKKPKNTKKTTAAKATPKELAKKTKPVKQLPKAPAVQLEVKKRRRLRIRRPLGVKARRARAKEARQGFNKLTSGYRLIKDSLSLVRQHWKLFGGITLVYFLLSFVLVGVNTSNFSQLRENFTGEFSQATASLVLVSVLLGSAGSTMPSGGSGLFASILVIVISLATIWALRQIMSGEKISIKDTFYKGMYPIIPFMLTLVILCIQLIPAVISAVLLSFSTTKAVFIGVQELILPSIFIALFTYLSVYFLIPSLFALYIVTLPNMLPLTAFKSALTMVKYRRWAIIRKLLFLILVIMVVSAVILLPLISFVPVVVVWVYTLMSMFWLIFAHIYIYSLYRELL